MAIQNINTIQASSDLELSYLQYYTDDYILQSLANLGQRFSTNAEGFSLGSFTFGEFFPEANVTSSEYIGVINKDVNSTITFNLCKYNNANSEAFEIEPDKSIEIENTSDWLALSEELEIPELPNSTSYAKNSIIMSSDLYYTIIFKGKLKGAESDITSEIVIDKFIKTTNEFLSGTRFITIGSNIYSIYVIYSGLNNDNVKTYTVSYSKVTSATSLDEISDSILTEENDDTILGITPETIYNKYKSNSPKQTTATLNTTESLYFNTDDTLLKDKIQFFSYDIAVLFTYVKKYYTNKTTLLDNLQFKKQILVSLFNAILEQSINATYIFVPINYSFNYICSNNDKYKIYYNAEDINVKYISVDSNNILTPSDISKYYDSKIILCESNRPTRVSLFNYSVDYDINDSEIIYGINIEKKYTLPYINSSNYWNINDVDTNIYAVGKDAGNPNIVILYTPSLIGYNKPEILYSASNNEILNTLQYTLKTVQVKYSTYIFNISSLIPTINTDDIDKIEKLKNSFVWSVSSVNCISAASEDAPIPTEMYGDNGNITTFWKFVQTDEGYEYQCLTFSEGVTDKKYYAYDINTLSGVDGMVKYLINERYNSLDTHPQRYLYNWLVLDSAVENEKNSVLANENYVCAVTNVLGEQYGTDYSNNTNFKIEYLNTINGTKTNSIENVDITSTRSSFISDPQAISTTNSFYNSKSKYEYVPNQSIPSIDLSEVLLRDVNTINRVNILTFGSRGDGTVEGLNSSGLYYSYIGSSFDINNKSVLTIGTSNKNINIGNTTLLPSSKITSFKKQTKFDVDFPNAEFKGNVVIDEECTVNGNLYSKYPLNVTINDNVKTISFIPIGKYLVGGVYELLSSDQSGTSNITKSSTILITNRFDKIKNNVLWCIAKYKNIDSEKKINIKDTYAGDLLYLPTLLVNIGIMKPEDDYIKFLNNITIASKNCTIIKLNGTPIFLLTNSWNLIGKITNMSVSHSDLNSNNVGNTLNISIITTDKTTIIIDETYIGQHIQLPYKIKTDY